ncbi:hypothetical protein SAMN05660772_01416 [Pasteurella testudinis DSM 23072]|uniref:Uncharacterized protein n=1 Tax=Pasteurella testudinis DSM 23072 TaxID=1122938 RepID=A0A1W1V9D6_9PAST|nr:hypothetical protein [Pasteurella testudinis]SMB89820.1 hypothetical protein SAMN05660772_01416 [Pasteurella testudinis DSM 23072]SUB52098.1 Uncharacterised protein [Pasteurella testudinis]
MKYQIEHLKRYIDIKDYSKNYVINSARINNDYDLYFLLNYINQKSKFPIYPEFSFNKSIKAIINDPDAPLLIIFQGFYEQYISPYYESDPELLNINRLNNTGLDFSFGGYIKMNRNFNYICVKDNYQSWYTINFDLYLSHIAKIILSINPSSIFTLGASAGGFASILFGHYLKANKAIAYSPQTVGFYHFMSKYRQMLNLKYGLSQIPFTDLKFLQLYNKGFNCKVDISLCDYNKVDKENLYRLDTSSGFSINKHAGKEHNIFAVVDKIQEFERITTLILSKNIK